MKIKLFLASLLSICSFTASADWYSCIPADVMSYSNRVHIRCANPVNGISFFAMSTSNAELADRFLSTATTALVEGKIAIILYDPYDLSGGTWGCLTTDCRNAQGIGLR